MTAPREAINVDLYSRNGFSGPVNLISRSSYSAGYSRVQGSYRPQRLMALAVPAQDPRSLPVSILQSATVRFDLWHLDSDPPFCLRDVHHDQLLFVQQGSAQLETDFGIIDLQPLDMVVLPRGVSYRLSGVEVLRMMIVATTERLLLDPESSAGLDHDRHLRLPRPYQPGDERTGTQELVIRHGQHTTSYFYDYDPLPILNTDGAPMVQKFNLADVTPSSDEGWPTTSPPPRLIAGEHSESLAFYLGARQAARPPIHHNVDYDEIGVYACGPGAFGRMTDPGTIVWVPKGLIHQGPGENVPEGYIAWLIETRADLELTDHGTTVAELMETDLFGIHPSADPAHTH